MNGSIGNTWSAAGRVRAAWARRGESGALPELGAILAELAGGDGGGEDAVVVDAVVADAEERWERGLAAGLEHYRAAIGELAGGAEVRRAVLMCEASRRSGEDPAEVRADFLARFPESAREVELVIGMLALISGAGSAEDEEVEAEDALGVGMRLGKYELRERLGAGSFGEVWRAWDTELARHVALKLLHGRAGRTASGAGSGTGGATRVIDEARAAASLRHENIVTVHDAGVFAENGRCYIDSELVADAAPTAADPSRVELGRSLEALVAEGGRLGARAAAELLAPVCGGVAAAHARGVLHRDLKPANILVSPSGNALIADFGLSVSSLPSSGGDSERGTGTVNIPTASGGRVVGTPAYMSPEQARGERFTPASDVYGLGATLRFALTGRAPYEPSGELDADGRWDVIKQVRAGGLGKLETERPDLPRTLARIVDRACAARVEDRYASADAMGADLRAWLSHRATVADVPGVVRSAGLWYRRNAAAATVGAVALVVMVAGTARFIDRVTEQRDRAVEAENLAESRLEEAEQARQVADSVSRFVESSVQNALATPFRGPPTMNHVMSLIAHRYENETPTDPLVAAGVAHFLGQCYLGMGANNFARKYAEQGLAVRRAMLGDVAPDTLRSRLLILRVGARERDRPELEAELRQLIADCEGTLGRESAEACEGMRVLSRLWIAKGRQEESAALTDDALARRRAALPEGHADLADWLIDAALPRRLRGDFAGAAELLEEAVRIRRARVGPARYETHAVVSELGQVYLSNWEWERAVPLLRDSAEGLKTVSGPTHGLTVNTVNLLVRALHLHGKDPAGALEAGAATMEMLRAEGSPGLGALDLAAGLGACLAELGQLDEARDLLEWAWEEAKVRPRSTGRATRAGVLLVDVYRRQGERALAASMQAELDRAAGRATKAE